METVGRPGGWCGVLFQRHGGLSLSRDVTLVLELVLPLPVRLLDFHCPDELHVWVHPDPQQVWSLTQFYSADFSQSRIGVKKCVLNKRTIKVCVSCC